MWKRRRKEIVICCFSSVIIVLLILALVGVFEYFGIHVPGSRDMWIGLIGAVIGGAFTLMGVLLTVYKQEEFDAENRRLEHIPLISFTVLPSELNTHFGKYSPEADYTITCWNGELFTSLFEIYESKAYQIIQLEVVNSIGAFDLVIEEIRINGNKIPFANDYSHLGMRLLPNESKTIGFDYHCDDKRLPNIFVVIRFKYRDLFANEYFQDLPFTYLEMARVGERKCSQRINIRDVKSPIYATRNNISLDDAMKDFVDYKAFCK